jgi:hypothetical protein
LIHWKLPIYRVTMGYKPQRLKATKPQSGKLCDFVTWWLRGGSSGRPYARRRAKDNFLPAHSPA